MDTKKMNFKAIDFKAIAKILNPRSFGNLDVFLESLPHNTSKTLLIITAAVWGTAGALGLFATVKMQEASELSVERMEARAVRPAVPRIQDKPVRSKEVMAFVEELKKTYKGLEIKGGSSNIIVTAKSTSMFGEFREAIGHIQNGGLGWRVNVEKLCVGKECSPNPLAASLKINQVSVEKE